MNLFRRKHPDQLERIAREGAGLSRLAHLAALLLILLFSAGSLVALGGDALASILTTWGSAPLQNIPAVISVAVSALMVVAMDTALVYAASVLRLLATRRASGREAILHWAVIAVVSALEAATYGLMTFQWEHPASLAAWLIVLARAGAAPLLSVYLSMARPLPVTAKDILAQAELAVGKGVVQDVVAIASQPDLPLADKLKLFGAAADLRGADRVRLGQMVDTMPDPDHQPDPPTKLSVVRQPVKSGSRETDARAAWDRGARTISQMCKETGLSRSAAGAWVRAFKAEQQSA